MKTHSEKHTSEPEAIQPVWPRCAGRKTWLRNMSLSWLAFIAHHLNANAEYVGWHPYLRLPPGIGVDIHNQLRPMPFVAQVSASPFAVQDGESTVDFRIANTGFDVVSSLNININAVVRLKVLKSTSDFSFADNVEAGADALRFIYTATRALPSQLYVATDVSPALKAEVERLKSIGYRGAGLYGKITQEFGTHWVAGVKRACKVSVVYTLTSNSSTYTRTLSNKLDVDGATKNHFEATLRTSLTNAVTGMNLAVASYSTDPHDPQPFTGRSITNFEAFQAFTSEIDTYYHEMKEENAKDQGYWLEPLYTIPGFTALIGEAFADLEDPGLEAFLQAYDKLAATRNMLTDWSTDPNRADFLADSGRSLVRSVAADIDGQLVIMRAAAKDYLEKGTMLAIPPNIEDLLAIVARIPVPRIHVVYNRYDPLTSNIEVLGYVDYGSAQLTRDRPGDQILLMKDGQILQGFFMFKSVKEIMNSLGFTSDTDENRAILSKVLQEPGWLQIEASAGTNRVAFFYAAKGGAPDWDQGHYALGLKNAAQSFIHIEDVLNVDSTLRLTARPLSSAADLRLTPVQTPIAVSSIGAAYSVGVTNYGTSYATGPQVRFSVPSANFNWIRTPWGSGRLDADGSAVVDLGVLGPGGGTVVSLGILPKGPTTPEVSATCSVPVEGENLTSPTTVAFPPLPTTPLELSVERKPQAIELSWLTGAKTPALESFVILQSGRVDGGIQSTVGAEELRISPRVEQREGRSYVTLPQRDHELFRLLVPE